MDTAQANRVTMFKTVSAHLAQHNSIWSGTPLMVTAVQQLNDTIAAINVAAQKQETATMGTVQDKGAARDGLEDVLFLMCEALGVLGHTGSDRQLVELVDLSPSALAHLSAEELSNRATSVLAQATARVHDLAALNVTQANIDELSQALQNFNASKEQPRTATAQQVAQTQTLSSLMSGASGILRNQTDKLVNLFRRTNAEFVAGYRAARVIVDRAATHKTTKPAGTTPPANA